MHIHPLLSLGLLASLTAAKSSIASTCPCGWRLNESDVIYTHRLWDSFRRYQPEKDIAKGPLGKQLTSQWWVNGYLKKNKDNGWSLDEQFETSNVELWFGRLDLKQQGYSEDDLKARRPVSIAGLQSKRTDILFGSFRILFKIEGDKGGSVGSFFWYHDDQSEIDIEIITRGNSKFNNTINYTSHPSLEADGSTIIPGATQSYPAGPSLDLSAWHMHRFDFDSKHGVKFYINDTLMHTDTQRVPKEGGSLQLNLWANDNEYWSGRPSTRDVKMTVRQILAYYNTTGTNNGTDQEWFDNCNEAGGPSEDTVCLEGSHADLYDEDVWVAPTNTPAVQQPIAAPSSSTASFGPMVTVTSNARTTKRSGVLMPLWAMIVADWAWLMAQVSPTEK